MPNDTPDQLAKKVLDRVQKEVASCLPNLEDMSTHEIAIVLLIYAHVIKHNFLAWMTMALTRCEGFVAYSTCLANLQCEANEDHPGMLANFVEAVRIKQGRGKPLLESAIQVTGRRVDAITRDCKVSGFNGVVVMTILENASLLFIPWLEAARIKYGEPLGMNNSVLTYTKKHGEADLAHAKQFVEALKGEYVITHAELPERVMKHTLSLIAAIFNAHKSPLAG